MLRKQNFKLLGAYYEAGSDLIDVHYQISKDLERRQNLLQDANGHVQRITNSLQSSIKEWTDFPEEEALEIGQSRTYIIDCPRLHPLTAVILKRLLRSVDDSSGIEVRLSIIYLRIRSDPHGSSSTQS